MSGGIIPGQVPHQATSGDSPDILSWEGDKMFNIYIYDYCYKRGFRKTARELLTEAGIPPDSNPPINARQGLLFEWWSVFWVLFTAKSSGSGTDDAMIYTQHQTQRQAQRTQPAAINRFITSMQGRQQGLMANGQLSNGVVPSALPGGLGPMPGAGQGPVSFPMSGAGPQPNGIPGAPGPAPGQGPSSQPPNFTQLMPGQRPGGPQQQQQQPQQQRGPPNVMPFQSPTMAHSPQNAPGGQQQQQQHTQAPMGQLGPSPHISTMNRGGMLPPNAPQGMNNPGSGQQGQSIASSFQQRPPSRTGTPSQNNAMTHPSPSFATRQPGGMSGTLSLLNGELSQIPSPLLNTLKQEANLENKEMHLWTPQDKQRIVTMARNRMKPGGGQQGPSSATAGPSGSNQPMQPPNQRNQQPGQPSQRLKRNSTSPAEEHETLPRNDNSPPDRKRVRRSPLGMEQQQQQQQQQPMTPMNYPHPSPQQGGQSGAQQMANGLMRPPPMGGPPINGFAPPQGMQNMGNNPGMNMQMPQNMGGPQMVNAMSPGMNHPGGMMQPQMRQFQEAHYRQSMHNVHMKTHPGGGMIPGNAGSPASSDPTFNPNTGQNHGGGAQFGVGGPNNNRMGQNKMMPPPSPAMNGQSKDQSGQNKDPKSGGSNPSNGHPEGSPRNAPSGGPGQGPGAPNTGNPGQGNNAPATPVTVSSSSMTAPSPSSILGNPTSSSMNQPQSTAPGADMIFNSEFLQSVASSLSDDFDPSSVFRTDAGDINFERDFGQWFSPDDSVAGPLDLK